MLCTVPVGWTVVTKAIYREQWGFFIGIKERLNVLDVLEIGSHKEHYKVVKFAKVTDYDGNIYKIVRTDGNKITSVDLELIKLGDKVRVSTRRSFQHKFPTQIFKISNL